MFYLGVLVELGSHGADDEVVVVGFTGVVVGHLFALVGDVVDADFFHVVPCGVAGGFGGEGDHGGDFVAGVLPLDAGGGGAGISGAFGVEHHLPESFDAGVGVGIEGEAGGGEIGEEAEFVALGEDDFAGGGLLRQDFPVGRGGSVDGCPPVGRVAGVAGGGG